MVLLATHVLECVVLLLLLETREIEHDMQCSKKVGFRQAELESARQVEAEECLLRIAAKRTSDVQAARAEMAACSDGHLIALDRPALIDENLWPEFRL